MAEKVEKLSDYECNKSLFDWSIEGKGIVEEISFIIAIIGWGAIGLILLTGNSLTLLGWILVIYSVAVTAYFMRKVFKIHKMKRQYDVLKQRYEQDKQNIEMLNKMNYDDCSDYHSLYIYLKHSVYDRYERGVVKEYYYIDELFFAKLKSYLALRESVGYTYSFDRETELKYKEIKNILDKSAKKYWESIKNHKNNQNKAMVDVVLNVFKEVEL